MVKLALPFRSNTWLPETVTVSAASVRALPVRLLPVQVGVPLNGPEHGPPTARVSVPSAVRVIDRVPLTSSTFATLMSTLAAVSGKLVASYSVYTAVGQ